MKKKLSLILALLMLCPTFAACAESESEETVGSSDTVSSVDAADSTAAEEETEITRQNTPDDLPDGLDFNATDITTSSTRTKTSTSVSFTLRRTQAMLSTLRSTHVTSLLRIV